MVYKAIEIIPGQSRFEVGCWSEVLGCRSPQSWSSFRCTCESLECWLGTSSWFDGSPANSVCTHSLGCHPTFAAGWCLCPMGCKACSCRPQMGRTKACMCSSCLGFQTAFAWHSPVDTPWCNWLACSSCGAWWNHSHLERCSCASVGGYLCRTVELN